jgi:hypothetical protein
VKLPAVKLEENFTAPKKRDEKKELKNAALRKINSVHRSFLGWPSFGVLRKRDNLRSQT